MRPETDHVTDLNLTKPFMGSPMAYAGVRLAEDAEVQEDAWFAFEQPKAKGEPAVITIDGIIGIDRGWYDGEELGKSAKRFGRELAAAGKTTPVIVEMNTPGGNVFDGSQIYHLLSQHKGKITIRIGSMCMSAGTVIAMAGDEIEIAPNSIFMIHNPWSIAIGEAKDMRKSAEVLDKIRASMLTAYKSRIKDKTDEEIIALLDAETWMTGEEAVADGWCTKLLDPVQAKACANMSADFLSRFKSTPEALKALVEAKAAAKAGEDSVGVEDGENEIIADVTDAKKIANEGDAVADETDPEIEAALKEKAEADAKAAADATAKAAADAAAQAKAKEPASDAKFDLKAGRGAILAKAAKDFGFTAKLEAMHALGEDYESCRAEILAAIKAKPLTANAIQTGETADPAAVAQTIAPKAGSREPRKLRPSHEYHQHQMGY